MMVFLALAMQMAAQDSPPKVEVSQSSLDAMSDACGAPRKWLTHQGGDEIRFSPSRRAKFEKVDCVLKRLRESMMPMKLGFVGNEQVPEEK